MKDTTFQNTTEFLELIAKYPNIDALMTANMKLTEIIKVYRIIEHESKVIDKTFGNHAYVCFDDIAETMHLDIITEMQDYLRFILAEHFVQMYENEKI